jgi:hypothetical protein
LLKLGGRQILVDVADNDVKDPDLEPASPPGGADPSAGPNAAELAPAEPDPDEPAAEDDEPDPVSGLAPPHAAEDDDYAMRVIRHRCGEKIADMVAPMSAFEACLLAIEAIQERIDEIESRTSAYGPVTEYDADACGPLQ